MTRAGGEDTNEHAVESRALRVVTYNFGQGGRRDAGLWLRLLGAPSPDLLFVQEPAAQGDGKSCLPRKCQAGYLSSS
ncbi:MAG: hypothetical protein ACM30E_02685 [Nitrososphaerales archaeon]